MEEDELHVLSPPMQVKPALILVEESDDQEEVDSEDSGDGLFKIMPRSERRRVEAEGGEEGAVEPAARNERSQKKKATKQKSEKKHKKAKTSREGEGKNKKKSLDHKSHDRPKNTNCGSDRVEADMYNMWRPESKVQFQLSEEAEHRKRSKKRSEKEHTCTCRKDCTPQGCSMRCTCALCNPPPHACKYCDHYPCTCRKPGLICDPDPDHPDCCRTDPPRKCNCKTCRCDKVCFVCCECPCTCFDKECTCPGGAECYPNR